MADDLPDLSTLLPTFIRAFGLHRPLQTPCGVGISVAEAHALTELAAGALTQSALAERLQLEKSTVSRLVTHMETQGWLLRTPAPTDSRVRQLSLTETGRRLAQQVDQARRAKFARLLARLTPTEHDQMKWALQRLIEVSHDPTDDA
ncbi:MAG TPA: MarR family transcriptional regulator [Herpetosiphonaceae bacterium]